METPTSSPPAPIAAEGHNCWRREIAERVAFLVDGDAYYRALKASLLKARHQILFVGWEIDSRTALDRGPRPSQPNAFGDLLDDVVRQRPDLRAYVLIWDSALLYSFDRQFLPQVKLDWLTHPRVHFRLDDAHPLGASHHQKIVVIDDRVAYLGGLDVTSRRWDTPAHDACDPRRSDPGFADYAPFHDLQILLTGPAAAALGALARQRWHLATGHLPHRPPPVVASADAWPDHVSPDLRDVPVALARTSPAWEGAAEVREVERLYLDMIAAARRFIYIENQYFASRRVARALSLRLRDACGPEVVMVTGRDPHSFLERTTMGLSRARLYERLQRDDHHGRLRFYCPFTAGRDIKVHSKLMVVDDCWLRIGSANLNNRSMGLDTECDALIEAEGCARVAKTIATFRTALLAEHLGVDAATVRDAVKAAGSLGGGIERLRARPSAGRTLEPLTCVIPSGLNDLVPAAALLDPDHPVEVLVLSAGMPGASALPFGRRLVGMAAGLLLLAAFALLWHWLPAAVRLNLLPLAPVIDQLRAHPATPVVMAAAFAVAGLLALPVVPLIVASAALFGMWDGAAYSFGGSLLGAAVTYGAGKALGRGRVRRLAGRQLSRVGRALARHGAVAVALMRLVPVATYPWINLMAGASRLPFRDYAVGTMVGITPLVLALSLFGDRVSAVMQRPDALNAVGLGGLTIALFAAAATVATRLARAAPTAAPGTDAVAGAEHPAGPAPVQAAPPRHPAPPPPAASPPPPANEEHGARHSRHGHRV